jgi:CMP-2-keto-3-deoxyoctulosonic acid synthetase
MKKIEINLQIRPSKDLLNKVVMSLLDYLLFSRSQIPFHYELFRTFVSKAVAVERKNDWKLEKQLKLANDTLERISALKRVRNNIFSLSPLSIYFPFQDSRI